LPDASLAEDRESLYALSWNCAQEGKLAVDADTGIVLDANPAAEALMDYSRMELMGMHITMLHLLSERERVLTEFQKTTQHATSHPGFHIKRKDGSCVPVAIWSSDTLQLSGRKLRIVEFRDTTEEEQKEQQLSAQNWALSAFSIAALALGRSHSEEGLLQSICEAITAQSVYVLAWVGVAEDGPDKNIRVAASAGSGLAYLDGLSLSWSGDAEIGNGPVGVSIRTDTVQIVEDSETSLAYAQWGERAWKFGFQSSLSIPLQIEDGWQGALNVYSVHPKAFQRAPIEVFLHLAEQIVHGIRALNHKHLLDFERLNLEQSQNRLTKALAASVSAMVTAMEMRDPYTAGHESRTADIAYAIGKEMGWPKGRLQGLRMAAMIHDIGKISIPSEILNKPAVLSAEEFALVRGHPERSYEILKDIPFPWPIAEIARQHHEKMDGSGYPRGLKRHQILPEAKVLAVADIVEAMAAVRPYREALGLKAALEEIERQAGTLLDPGAVRICAALFRERRLIIPGFNID
jgi:PAS domain S-box-containing protein